MPGFADNFLANLGHKRREAQSQEEIVAAIRMLMPDTQRQTSVGVGTESNQAARDQMAQVLGGRNSPAYAQALQQIAIGRQFPKPQEPYTLGQGEVRFDANNKQVAAGPDKPPPGSGGGITGSLQELNAINADRRAQGLPPVTPEEYFRERRGTSANSQAFYQRGTTQPSGQPGVQPMSEQQFTTQRNAGIAGAETRAKGTAEMWVKRREDLPKAKQTVRTITLKNEQLVSRVDSLLNNPDLQNVVGHEPGRLIGYLPGTLSANAKQEIESLQKALSLEAIGDLRQMSPTGGALGQITEGEYPILQSMISALNVNMTAGEFVKQLQAIRQRLQATTVHAQQAYDESYGPDFQAQFPSQDVRFQYAPQEPQPLTSAPAPAAAPLSVDQLVQKYAK